MIYKQLLILIRHLINLKINLKKLYKKLNFKFKNPWLIPPVLISINLKNKLNTSSRNDQSKRDDYKKYRSCLTSVMRKAKLYYYKTLLNKFKNSSSKLWARMKSILCTSEKSNIPQSPHTSNDLLVSVLSKLLFQ